MTILNTYDGALFVWTITGLAHDLGVHIRLGDDFHEYRDIIKHHRPEQPPAPPLDPDVHDMSSGFWFTGTDAEGKLVFTQAMRDIDLGDLTLAEYLTANFRDFPPASLPVDVPNSRYLPGPAARKITGRVCYHADLWMRPGESSYRGSGLPNVLARLAMVTAIMRGSPDYIFGFIARNHAFKGLGEREGYMHSEPSALHWLRADKPETLVCQMVWMGREDLEHLLTIPPEGVMRAA